MRFGTSAHRLKVLYAGKPLSNLISQVLLGKVANGPLFQQAVLSFRILSLAFLTKTIVCPSFPKLFVNYVNPVIYLDRAFFKVRHNIGCS